MQGYVTRHSQFIEFVLRSPRDYLKTLCTSANTHYNAAGRKLVIELSFP